MKKLAAMILAAALSLGLLSGCDANALFLPDQAVDGTKWEKTWVTVGGLVGVDAPAGMTPLENNEALASAGIYYATWSLGEGQPYTNEDGNDTELYDAQVYLLLNYFESEEEAQDALSQWLELARERYVIEGESEQVHNGQSFTVFTSAFDSDTNPYARGASAFGRLGSYAISIELACQQDFDGSADELLEQFLDGCHYAPL